MIKTKGILSGLTLLSDPIEVKKRVQQEERSFAIRKIVNNEPLAKEILDAIEDEDWLFEPVKSALLRGQSPNHILTVIEKWKRILE